MKNALVLTVFAALLFGACSKNDQNQIITEKRSISAFDQIRVNAPGLVEISEGANFSLQIEGNESDLAAVETFTNGKILQISFWKTNFSSDLRIKITTPRAIKNVQNVGQATISFLGTTKTPEIFVSSEGQGAVIFQNLETEKFHAVLKGAGNLKLAGKATQETVNLQDSATFEGLQFMADDSEITLMGSGSTTISVKNRLRAHIAGSGTVSYKGEPTIFEDITGSGKLVKL